MTPLEGVLVVDKPAGPTSHDIVDQVRRLASLRRVGHTGTLDPLATGVLPLCLGRATRLARFLTSTRKVYRGTIRLGEERDTDDATGRILTARSTSYLDPGAVREASSRIVGTYLQAPPVFSARKVGGRPMHRLAREGTPAPAVPAAVTIHRFDLIEIDLPLIRFEAESGPGTYMRSLARDLGRALGCGGHLTELRRLGSGRFNLEDAHRIESIRSLAEAGALHTIVVPLRMIDLGLPSLMVTREGADAMRSGRALDAAKIIEAAGSGGPATSGSFRVQDEDGNLMGVAVGAAGPDGAKMFMPRIVLVA